MTTVCGFNYRGVRKGGSPQVTFNIGSTKSGLSDQENLEVNLIDFFDVTMEQVQEANHGRVGCVCALCAKLKNLEIAGS